MAKKSDKIEKQMIASIMADCRCQLCRPNDLFIDGVNMSAEMQGYSAEMYSQLDKVLADAFTEGNSTPEGINTEPATAEEFRNPFKVIADWLRGNPLTESDKEQGFYERIPESNFVTTGTPRAFLINPRTGEQAEIPIQSFELGGWERIAFPFATEESSLRTLSMESHPSYAAEPPRFALEELTIISHERYDRLLEIEKAYCAILDITKE